MVGGVEVVDATFEEESSVAPTSKLPSADRSSAMAAGEQESCTRFDAKCSRRSDHEKSKKRQERKSTGKRIHFRGGKRRRKKSWGVVEVGFWLKLSLIEAKVNESEEARRDETRRAWRVRVGMGKEAPGSGVVWAWVGA